MNGSKMAEIVNPAHRVAFLETSYPVVFLYSDFGSDDGIPFAGWTVFAADINREDAMQKLQNC